MSDKHSLLGAILYLDVLLDGFEYMLAIFLLALVPLLERLALKLQFQWNLEKF